MKKIIAIILLLVISLGNFTVSAGTIPAENTAQLLSSLKIMVGDENNNLHLDNLVSRAEFTKIAVATSNYRNMVANHLKTSSYKDVPANHWAAPYIKTGVDNRLCKGYYDSTFRPNNTVKYEEAITMLLRVLGYTDEDFGSSWPYGQVGIAESLGINDNAKCTVGEDITRRKAALLVYNALNTKMKNSSFKLMSIFDAEKIEDTVLISTTQKSTFSKNEVNTSKGTFKYNSEINETDIGKDGDLYIKNGDTLLAFIPYAKTSATEKHIVYSVLSENIITYCGGKLTSLSLAQDTKIFENNVETTFAAKSAQIEMGDILYVQKTNQGDLDYIVYEKGNVKGPFTVLSANDYSAYTTAKILRNGEESTKESIKPYDIIYYVNDLDMLLCYSNKITGIYEKAEPNKDTPEHVIVSGKKYKIESSTAFEKLSSSGKFKYGDTITILLGKTNDVADVVNTTNQESVVYGYLCDTGRKEYTKGDVSTYTNYYISVVTPDGKTNEYITDKNHENYKNSVKKITFQNGIASASDVRSNFETSGTFDWTNKKLGSLSLSPDLNIIDVSTTDPNKTGKFSSVFPNRINGVNLSKNNVLYMEKNEEGQVSSLILKDVTGDVYDYGIIIKAENKSNPMYVAGDYKADIGGIVQTFSTNGTAYGVESGNAAKFVFGKTSSVQTLESVEVLNKITEKITNINETTLTTNSRKYIISDKVTVYKKAAPQNYTIIPLADVITNDSYTINAYYDKKPESGGRIRIIIVSE